MYVANSNFVAKLDTTTLSVFWAQPITGIKKSIVVDGIGNTYVAGDSLFKLDNLGNTSWTRSISASGVALDNAGSLYVTGDFVGTSSFPNPLTSAGGTDIFIAKLNATSGITIWAKRMGGANNDNSNAIAVDVLGTIYTVGNFENTSNFDPLGSSNANVVANGIDGFISRLDNLGNFLSIKQIRGILSGARSITSIVVKDNIYITGYSDNEAYFDFPVLTISLPRRGGREVFIAKYNQRCATITLASLPNNIIGTGYNQILTQVGLAGTPTWSISAGALPTGLMLDAITGVISGTTNVLGTYTFTVQVTDGACTQIKQYTIIVTCPTIVISPSILPNGVINVGYNQILSQTGLPTGGRPPSWSIISGNLPTGLVFTNEFIRLRDGSLSSIGVLSGTPTAFGTFTFTVQVIKGGCSQTQTYTIIIGCQVAPIVIVQTSLPAPSSAVAYSEQLTQTGLVGSISWSVISGFLPNGLTLTSSGLLSGTPSAIGVFNFTIQVSNGSCSQTQAYTMTFTCSPVNAGSSYSFTLPDATLGSFYSQTLIQSVIGVGSGLGLGTNITIVSFIGMPLGLSPSGNIISGIPTQAGFYTIYGSLMPDNRECQRGITFNIAICDPNRAAEIINFNPIRDVCAGIDPFILNAQTNTGAPITYTSTNTNIATVSGNIVTIVGVGRVCIKATASCAPPLIQCFQVYPCKIQNTLIPKNEVNLYPNPTEGVFEVEFAKSMGTLNVEVANVTGVVVLKETFTKKTVLENANETIKLDISALPAGLYFVKWNNGIISDTKKVVKR